MDCLHKDVVDALAAAVTGYYGYAALQTLPENPLVCPQGLPMEMVYWVPPETVVGKHLNPAFAGKTPGSSERGGLGRRG